MSSQVMDGLTLTKQAKSIHGPKESIMTTTSGGDAHGAPEVVTLEPANTVVIPGTVPMSEATDFFDRSFRTLAETMAARSIAPSSPAFALYHGPPAETADLEVGFVVDQEIEPSGDVLPSSLPGGRAARVIHAGPFDQLGSSWEGLREWIGAEGLKAGRVIWEVYLTEPSPDMDPQDLRTELNWTLET
jgi:effector-binding domain-containing protein